MSLTLQDLSAAIDQALAKGATAAKAVWSNSSRQACEFEAGRLKTVESSEHGSYSIEVLKDGRRSSASGNRAQDLPVMVERALALAPIGAAAHFDRYPAPQNYTPVKLWNQDVADLPLESMLSACKSIIDPLQSHDADLYLQAGFSRSTGETLLVTSGGLKHSTRGTRWSLSGSAQATDGTDMLFVGDGQGWRSLEHFAPARILERMRQDLDAGRTIVPAPSGLVQALLPPQTVGMLLEALIMGIDGRSVFKGESPLARKLGEKIFDPAITLIDDPHKDFCLGASSMDGDGIATQVMPIVKDGVLKTFLYDLDTAGMAGKTPTGHGGCTPNNLVMRPGTISSARLQEGISDGLLVKDLLGFGQGNLINGDFSCNLGLGYRIQGGKITGRVKNAMIAGNVYQLFGSKITLSSDIDPILGLPWMLIEGLSVSG